MFVYCQYLSYLCTLTARGRAAVARRAHNPKVTGSIPVLATKFKSPLSGAFLWYILFTYYTLKITIPYIQGIHLTLLTGLFLTITSVMTGLRDSGPGRLYTANTLTTKSMQQKEKKNLNQGKEGNGFGNVSGNSYPFMDIFLNNARRALIRLRRTQVQSLSSLLSFKSPF